MKKFLWIFALVAAVSSSSAQSWSSTVTLRRIEERKEVEGYWALSSEWRGYMGIALELREGRFRYWFRSDVRMPNEPKYPVTGKYEIDAGLVKLLTESRVYDTEWLLISCDGRIGLFPASGFSTTVGMKESPSDRMLFRIDDEEAKKSWPIYNEPKKEPNQPPEPTAASGRGSP